MKTLHLSFNRCSSCFCKIFCFSLIYNLFIYSASSSPPPVSYADHCSSIVPESNITNRIHSTPSLPPDLLTIYYNGGERIFGKKPGNQSYEYMRRPLRIRFSQIYDETVAGGVYKVKAYLIIRPPYRAYDFDGRNSSYGGSFYHRNADRGSRALTFFFDGFWSNSSRELCMIGSASRRTGEGEHINLDAILKLNYGSDEPDMFSSVISGTLESLNSADGSGYFEPISIFGVPDLVNYNYSFVSKELGKWSKSGSKVLQKNQSLSVEPSRFCSMLSGSFLFFDLEYGLDCKEDRKCSPLSGADRFLARGVSLIPIQCSLEGRKLRFLIRFQNASYFSFYEAFDLNSTMIGEGSWDDYTDQLFIVGCRILDPANRFGDSVGDCSLRMSLRYPSIWTITKHAKVVGKMWTNRTVDDPEYFSQINLFSNDKYERETLMGLRYEYTESERVKRQCKAKKVAAKGVTYPRGDSYNMRFDMGVKNSKGKKLGWGYAIPRSVGDDLYQIDQLVAVAMAPESNKVADTEFPSISEPEKIPSPLNISFTIFISPYTDVNNSLAKANQSLIRGGMEISAEGVYYAETGHLCMVGCRRLLSSTVKSVDDSIDCEILVRFDFPPLNDKKGGLIKGSILSTRAKTDRLYFEDLSVTSATFVRNVAKQFIWRMDIETTMVLISNTLTCIFVGLQILHVKKNPEAAPSGSLVMLLILSLGHMIPLVLNFEALFSKNHYKQAAMYGAGGWLEANEIGVRVVTMIAFLMHLRLLQLAWTSKTSDGDEKGSWAGEKKTVLASLTIYILGGLLTLSWKWNRDSHQQVRPYQDYQSHDVLRYFMSYAGLILDGFLMPQILFNCFSGSSAKALSHPFYIGTSAVRLAPHAYNQYRAHNFPTSYVNGTYYYANPTADFYSTAWDVAIPFGVISLAVIIFVQQRLGGRCILPKRFRELELYEKVPTAENL